MPDDGRRARLLQAIIWLATLFFAAMLFVPLISEALRRAAVPSPGGHF
jgi:preprotein translocase subunit SecG